MPVASVEKLAAAKGTFPSLGYSKHLEFSLINES